MLTLAALAAGGLRAIGRAGIVTRVVVEGPSMLPALAPGERLVVVRLPVLEVGDIVALRDPEQPERVLLKRVSRLEASSVEVRGDNEAVSRDSRAFGRVPRREVLGRVVYRYHPTAAAGPFRRASRYDGSVTSRRSTRSTGGMEP